MQMKKTRRTPARIMADLLECAMKVQGETKQSLAAKLRLSKTTVYDDFKEPERIPQNRLWLYFTALDAPMDETLLAVAERFAQSAVRR